MMSGMRSALLSWKCAATVWAVWLVAWFVVPASVIGTPLTAVGWALVVASCVVDVWLVVTLVYAFRVRRTTGRQARAR
jgi:hypothetical protein